MDFSTLVATNFLCILTAVMLVRQWHDLPPLEFDNREIIVTWFCTLPPFGVFGLLTVLGYGAISKVASLVSR